MSSKDRRTLWFNLVNKYSNCFIDFLKWIKTNNYSLETDVDIKENIENIKNIIYTEEELKKKTCNELRDLLRAAKCKLGRNKETLIKNLLEYYKNK